MQTNAKNAKNRKNISQITNFLQNLKKKTEMGNICILCINF